MLHDLLILIFYFHREDNCSSACLNGFSDNLSAQSHRQILCEIKIFCFSKRNSMNEYAKVYSPLAGALLFKLGAFSLNDIDLKNLIVFLVLFTKFDRNIFDFVISLRQTQGYGNRQKFTQHTRQFELRMSRMSK